MKKEPLYKLLNYVPDDLSYEIDTGVYFLFGSFDTLRLIDICPSKESWIYNLQLGLDSQKMLLNCENDKVAIILKKNLDKAIEKLIDDGHMPDLTLLGPTTNILPMQG